MPEGNKMYGTTITIIIAITIYYIGKRKYELIKQQLKEVTKNYRSTLVKHGKTWEHFIPFTKEFQKIGIKENAKFLGKPIDYIIFDEDKIKFVEIKTGNSKLSKKQAKIKKQIKNKEIEWKEINH